MFFFFFCKSGKCIDDICRSQYNPIFNCVGSVYGPRINERELKLKGIIVMSLITITGIAL